jgi:2-dehydro-3-deoxyphosphooctonate aldolase (KDO 8-P synthase)
MNEVTVGGIRIGKGNPMVLIAGPCVIENEEMIFTTAQKLKEVCDRLNIPLIFKSSYDKANRTSITSFRGPGIDRGLKILSEVKKKFSVPVISDIHALDEIKPASEILDALQIPAFLCRQTDLILSASRTGKPVNVKKGQFLAPWDVKPLIEKFVSTGNQNLFLTERGTSFGYNNLIVDFRGFSIIRSFGYPLFFDVTHSLQLPGGEGSISGGQREFAPSLTRAAVAAGVDGLFIEVHPDPVKALSDASTMISLIEMEGLLRQTKTLHDMIRKWEMA